MFWLFNKNTFWLRIIAFLLLMLFVSAFKSCQEIRYVMGSNTAVGKVTKIEEQHSRHGRLTGYYVWYEFKNEELGKRLKFYSEVGINDGGFYEEGDKVDIDYYGTEKEQSRLADVNNHNWVIVFFCFLAVFCILVGWLAWRASRAAQKKRDRA